MFVSGHQSFMMPSILSCDSASLTVSCFHILAAPITRNMNSVLSNPFKTRACNSYTQIAKKRAFLVTMTWLLFHMALLNAAQQYDFLMQVRATPRGKPLFANAEISIDCRCNS